MQALDDVHLIVPRGETQTEYARVYVGRLRAKLEDEDGPPLILTEPRAGYRFNPRVVRTP